MYNATNQALSSPEYVLLIRSFFYSLPKTEPGPKHMLYYRKETKFCIGYAKSPFLKLS
jgi:hypothetical protein